MTTALDQRLPQDRLAVDDVIALVHRSDPEAMLQIRYHCRNNQVYALRWRGRDAVIKVAGTDRSPQLSVEARLLPALARRGLQVPTVWQAHLTEEPGTPPYLIMERFAASPVESLTPAQRSAWHRARGAFVAQVGALRADDDLPVTSEPESRAGFTWWRNHLRSLMPPGLAEPRYHEFWPRFDAYLEQAPFCVAQHQAADLLTDGQRTCAIDWNEGLCHGDPVGSLVNTCFYDLMADATAGRAQLKATCAGYAAQSGTSIDPDGDAVRLWIAFTMLSHGIHLHAHGGSRLLWDWLPRFPFA